MKLMAIFRRYGWFGSFRLACDMLHTRCLFPRARLVRRPAYVRGAAHIAYGRGLTAGVGLRLDAFPRDGATQACIEFGDDVQLNDYVHIGAVESVRIGNRVLIASKVFIADHNHGGYGRDHHDSPQVPPAERPLRHAPVAIEDDVWIGEFAVILPGVRIGRGAVVAAAAVVTRDIPPYTVAAGNPARVITRYNFESKAWEPANSDGG